MRDIRLRAWNRIVERMSEPTTITELYRLGKSVQWQNIEVMQSTNMYDCNDVEIFEGDIISWNTTEAYNKPKGHVYYSEKIGGYVIKCASFESIFNSSFCQPSSSKSFEVIGNIYQDKDLIK